MKEDFEKLLIRQLRKNNIDYLECDEAMQNFIKTVNESYKMHFKDNKLQQRAMNISSIELQEKNDKLKESVNLSEQFAFIVAHDLKEPLRTISSFLNLLYKRNENIYEDVVSKEYVQFIDNGVKRMEFYLNDLMNFLVINKDKSIKLDTVNLNELVENCKSDLLLVIKEKNAIITYNELPTIEVYKNHFIQLFLNLISNALKFNKANKAPKINITYKNLGNELLFEFEDNGIGISEEYLNKVFKIFYRISKNFQGTGIGLAICKKIVDTYDGSISIDKCYQQGTKFIIKFPSKILT